METLTIPHNEYSLEQYDNFVGASAIAEGLQAKCISMLYHEVEFPEDAPLVKNWSSAFNEIKEAIKISNEATIQRAYKLKPLVKTLTLNYILNNPNGWEKL